MTPSEINKIIDSMRLLVDTREQPTQRFKNRVELIALPYIRRKLDVGDYSAEFDIPTNSEQTITIDFSKMVAIERKMNIDELAMCLTSERKRFTAEFERASEQKIKMYLLVENASWEKIINHSYRSQMEPNALIGSLCSFLSKYNMQLIFCRDVSTTPQLMRKILTHEVRTWLELEYELFG